MILASMLLACSSTGAEITLTDLDDPSGHLEESWTADTAFWSWSSSESELWILSEATATLTSLGKFHIDPLSLSNDGSACGDLQDWLDVGTALIPLEQASLFLIDAVPADGVSPQEALAAIESQLELLRSEPLGDERLARARRQLELGLYHDLETVEERADMLGSWELFQGGAAALMARPESWAQLDGEQVRASAAQWLTPERRNVVVLFPTENDGGVE